jgi:glycosyltransferase involved in cell wall biosynthesis
MRPIVFIIPWFHEDVGGGSEVKVREYATRLLERGHQVEVWCTCARDFHDNWNVDHWPAGLTEVRGIPTRRFPVRKGDHGVFNSLNARLLGGERLLEGEEEQFFRESINSDALLAHIREEGEGRHLIFTPYLYGTTYHGTRTHPHASLLFPEFHSEPYVRMGALRRPVEAVSGLLFNTGPEAEMAAELFDIADTPQIVIGQGISDLAGGDPTAFRAKHGLGDDPFVLCVGRQSPEKNVGLLCDFFTEYRRAHPERRLRLVLIGKPDMALPEHPDILQLGFVPWEEKRDAHCAATVLCQPSVNESLSIVALESLVCEVPILVNGWCAVTRHHCEVSGGGLWFKSHWDFQETLSWLLDHPEERRRMGRQGRAHVRAVYRWEIVLDRLEVFMGQQEARLAAAVGTP